MNILVLDNYDSFTYNLVQYIWELVGVRPTVRRNDEITLDEVAAFDSIVLSPGPGLPAESGIMPELIKRYATTKNILGVCLGHQAIAEAFGGTLYNLDRVLHGVATSIFVTDVEDALFKNVPAEFVAGRYHSWAVVKENLPDCLHITAEDDQKVIMALSHKEYNVKGVQFHPESVMTPYGKQLLKNFLQPKRSGAERSHALEYVF